MDSVEQVMKGLTKAQAAFLKRGYVDNRRGYWPMRNGCGAKGLIDRFDVLTPLGRQVRARLLSSGGEG